MTKFYSMFTEFFKESDRFHTCPAVANTQQREDFTHHLCGAVVIDIDDSDSDNKDNVMPPLIHPEDSNNENSLSNPPSTEPTLDTVPPSEKPTK